MPPVGHEATAAYEGLVPVAAGVEARPAACRTKVLATLGFGLAVAAAYTFMREGGASGEAPKWSALEGVQGKFPEVLGKFSKAAQKKPPALGKFRRGSKKTPKKLLVVEDNLGDFVDDDVPEDAHPGRLGVGIGNAALKLFEHVVNKSGVDREMTGSELSAFKYRFVANMVGTQDTNIDASQNYLERARKHLEGAKPVLTEALAVAINKRETSYKVNMQPWMLDESMDSLNDRLIQIPYSVAIESRFKQHEGRIPEDPLGGMLKEDTLPDAFKSAEAWPKCAETIEAPLNQGRCGSCWVFGALGALDSRLCIKTDGAFSGPHASLSRGYGASCAVSWDGCQGGYPHLVYDYIEKNSGVPSTDCDPYFGGSNYADHWSSSMPAPTCPAKCDARSPLNMASDMYNPIGIANYMLVDTPDQKGMEQLKKAIFQSGPVPYAFAANNEFMGYVSGVFNSGCGTQANHAVQAIGWGKMKVGRFWSHRWEDYIQSLNSWGTHWGIQGKFNVAYCVVWHYAIPGDFSGEQQFPNLVTGKAAEVKDLLANKN